jgi:1-acyl-sn-glycerol-3-phosphate acyltransferase
MFEQALSRAGQEAIRLYAATMLDTDVEWQAGLPPGPKVLAANHPTTTDPFYLLALMPAPASVLVTNAAFKIPVFGLYLRAAGHVPAVPRSGGATLETLQQQLVDGYSVAIFPEGALSPCAGKFHPPHTGVARLALNTGVPVIPVGIDLDHARVLPFTFKIDGQAVPGRLYLGGCYAMTVGRPMWFQGSGQDRQLARSVAGQIMQRIGELTRESACRIARRQVPTRPMVWPAPVTSPG